MASVLAEEPVDVLFIGFSDSSRNVCVRWWIGSYLHRWRVLDEVSTALDVALVQAGIDLPYTTYALQVKMENDDGALQPKSGTNP